MIIKRTYTYFVLVSFLFLVTSSFASSGHSLIIQPGSELGTTLEYDPVGRYDVIFKIQDKVNKTHPTSITITISNDSHIGDIVLNGSNWGYGPVEISLPQVNNNLHILNVDEKTVIMIRNNGPNSLEISHGEIIPIK
ncbi:MAG: hypothetical protein H0U71_09825 [Gammaproteobacteria bacterium]|nr:hypothetical protein [Gammaproteobacteria bacterium]